MSPTLVDHQSRHAVLVLLPELDSLSGSVAATYRAFFLPYTDFLMGMTLAGDIPHLLLARTLRLQAGRAGARFSQRSRALRSVTVTSHTLRA